MATLSYNRPDGTAPTAPPRPRARSGHGNPAALDAHVAAEPAPARRYPRSHGVRHPV